MKTFSKLGVSLAVLSILDTIAFILYWFYISKVLQLPWQLGEASEAASYYLMVFAPTNFILLFDFGMRGPQFMPQFGEIISKSLISGGISLLIMYFIGWGLGRLFKNQNRM